MMPHDTARELNNIIPPLLCMIAGLFPVAAQATRGLLSED